MSRAELGVDGDHAFALLGLNIQDGEAEFVPIKCVEPRWTAEFHLAARAAAWEALTRLRARLPDRPSFSYFLGESHPDHC